MTSLNSARNEARANGGKAVHDAHADDVNARLRSEAFQQAFDLGYPPVDTAAVEDATRQLLVAVGEDPLREGLANTPRRVARAYEELLAGYRTDPVALVNDALFNVEQSDMVVVSDIDFYSLCEHHLLPFYGKAHVAYLPAGKVIGLSKIPRIVEMFARRLQLQERLTRQIAGFVDEVLQPEGVAVVLEGVHLCARMRGVENGGTRMTSSTFLGRFESDPAARAEFLTHIRAR
ncbi:MAG: GTP cyclohydrolase I FolE [Chloroflexota bacterium]|nr:MAG: GTP cyclohydrolase I FolE [Chloroflexota bacterium]